MGARTLPIRYLSGDASEQEIEALEAWLLESPVNALLLAECAVDEQNLSAAVQEVLEQIEESEQAAEITPELLAALQPKGELEPVDITESVLAQERARLETIELENARRKALAEEAARSNSHHVIVIPKPVVWLASAAMIGLLVWLGSQLLPSDQSSTQEVASVDPTALPKKVAEVRSTSSDAVWAHPGVTMDGLRIGVQAELLSGVAEIKFDQGATVIVHGHAVFTPTSVNALKLNQGQLVAEVPPSAVGFEVDTRFGMIRDFGTEFGVMVDALLGLRTQVYKGEIGVMARDTNNELGAMTRLFDNEAAKISAGHAQVVQDEPAASGFVRREGLELLTKENPSPAERWKAHLYKLELDSYLIAHLGFSQDEMQLTQGPAGQTFEAKWIGGEVISLPGNAQGTQVMRLGGTPEQGFDLHMKGHPGFETLTFIAWARVEPQPNRTNAPLLHHSRIDMAKSTPNWQLRPDLDAVHINQFAEVGTTKTNRRVAAKLEGIAWEQWHCYAVVLHARTGQCEHYLDGRWVGSGELAQKVPLRIDGLRIASTGREVTAHPRTIKGEIGQFTFLNTALDAEGVRQIFDASRELFE